MPTIHRIDFADFLLDKTLPVHARVDGMPDSMAEFVLMSALRSKYLVDRQPGQPFGYFRTAPAGHSTAMSWLRCDALDVDDRRSVRIIEGLRFAQGKARFVVFPDGSGVADLTDARDGRRSILPIPLFLSADVRESRAAGTAGKYGHGTGWLQEALDPFLDLQATMEPIAITRDRADSTMVRDQNWPCWGQGPTLENQDRLAIETIATSIGEIIAATRRDQLPNRQDGKRADAICVKFLSRRVRRDGSLTTPRWVYTLRLGTNRYRRDLLPNPLATALNALADDPAFPVPSARQIGQKAGTTFPHRKAGAQLDSNGFLDARLISGKEVDLRDSPSGHAALCLVNQAQERLCALAPGLHAAIFDTIAATD